MDGVVDNNIRRIGLGMGSIDRGNLLVRVPNHVYTTKRITKRTNEAADHVERDVTFFGSGTIIATVLEQPFDENCG